MNHFKGTGGPCVTEYTSALNKRVLTPKSSSHLIINNQSFSYRMFHILKGLKWCNRLTHLIESHFLPTTVLCIKKPGT